MIEGEGLHASRSPDQADDARIDQEGITEHDSAAGHGSLLRVCVLLVCWGGVSVSVSDLPAVGQAVAHPLTLASSMRWWL